MERSFITMATVSGASTLTYGTHHATSVVASTGIENVAVHTAAEAAGTSVASGGLDLLLSSTGIWLAAAASTVINVIKYKNLRSDLCEIYRDEIGAKLGKTASQVTKKDMDVLAVGVPERGIPANETLSEELKKLKRDRDIGIGVTAISILFAIPLTLAVMTAIFSLPVAWTSLSLSSITLPIVGKIATQFAVGFACHKLMEYPVEAVGKSVLGVEGNTTHERIESLVKEQEFGKSISKEQVLGVFVSANKQLSQFVQQNFGKEYDKLEAQTKQVVAQAFERYIPLTEITESLNSGRVKITELAFSVVGQKSGVKPSETPVAPKVNVLGKVRGLYYDVTSRLKLRPALQKLPEQRENHHQMQPQRITQPAAPPARPVYKEMYYEQNERNDGRKWSQVVKPQNIVPTAEPTYQGGRA
jgi:hypothetical protein